MTRLSSGELHRTPTEPDALEVAPGTAHEQLEGWIPQLATEEEIRVALEKAFDYRGDITITRKDGSKIEGYLFDRRPAATLKDSLVRLYPKNSNEKVADRLRRHRRSGFHRTRHRRRTKLGSLDEKVRREESRRRKRFKPASRAPRIIRYLEKPCHPERSSC